MLKILTIDDSTTMRRIIINTLNKLGYTECREAGNGRKIPLRVAVLPAISRPTLEEPIVVLSGGPGQAASTREEKVGTPRRDQDRDTECPVAYIARWIVSRPSAAITVERCPAATANSANSTATSSDPPRFSETSA